MGKIWHVNRVIPKKHARKFVCSEQLWLSHDERYVRRKLLTVDSGKRIMLNLYQAKRLVDGDVLDTEEGEYFLIRAVKELLYEVKGKNELHLLCLAWHLGNRHLEVEVSENFILLQRNPVIAAMLEGLGAKIKEVEATFHPLYGAYHPGHNHY